MHKSPFLFFLAIVSLLLIVPSAVDASTLYDTGKLSINAWHVHLSSHTFRSNNPSSATVKITRSTPGSEIRYGFLIFNRRMIPLKRFFNGTDVNFQKKIQLQHRNRLRVFLVGSPDASITIGIHADSADPPGIVDFSATPETITTGAASTLTWSSVMADVCIIEPAIGVVDANGSLTVSPESTTTYTLTANGSGGSASSEVTLTVKPPAPTIDLSALPAEILKGESATLVWRSANADSCAIEPGIGGVDTQGSIDVNPSETTTYTITASGDGGTNTDGATVTVYQPPTINVSVFPQILFFGESATLSWRSANAETATIDQGVGTVEPNGSTTVFPTGATTYTITVSGPGGTASARAQVMVQSVVAPLPDGSFGRQYEDLVPSDATLEAYDSYRFSLITGLVLDSSDLPIEDVSVTIHNHAEYGTATTDDQGRFTLPVEGGSTMTVVYQKTGLITSHRQVYVPWNDIAIADSVQLIAEDTASTTVAFDGNPDTVVTHRSKPVEDEFGRRSATMVFTGDNRAWRVDENGNDVQELSTITTRATEFATPESMPAKLPPNSAYTYCAELSVDEAERVRFDKPVVLWVENFLGFDVGEIVPVGYYDRDRGVWVPEDNGVVVRLLDADGDGIVDALDTNGDDLPDDLDEDGSFSDEVKGLGDSDAYPPETTFWRVTVSHFTPWDCNWPYGPPEDAIPPNPEGEPDIDQQLEDDCKGSNCSFVEERSRIFHEDIPVPGTDMTLHYASNRVKGHKTIISVPASGQAIPDSLKNIIVKVEIAGRQFKKILPPLPNQIVSFLYNHLDHLSRPAKGITAHIHVGFLYNAVYWKPIGFQRAFARVGENATPIKARQELVSWRHSEQIVLSKTEGILAEGWTLSSHHHVNSSGPSIIHKGNGSIARNTVRTIETVAGNGQEGFCGDEGIAAEACLNSPSDLIVDATGNIFAADTKNNRIRKIDTNGIITTVAGNGSVYNSGDGRQATETGLNAPVGIAVDSKSNLYIAEWGSPRIRKVDTSGMITTVAGNGQEGFSGDGGIATEAMISVPHDIAVDNSGNLYIADFYNHRIRKVDTNGVITTVAGNGNIGYSEGDNGPAIEASIAYPYTIEVDSEGNLFIIEMGRGCIRKVDISGTITSVIGSGFGFSGDGGPATEARFDHPTDISLDPAGNFYISDSRNHRIRMVDTSGIVTTIAGSGDSLFNGDGGPALLAGLIYPSGVSINNEGELLISSAQSNRIRKISILPSLKKPASEGKITFAEDGGNEIRISSTGLHEATMDLDTGVPLRNFAYDGSDNLFAITDQFGNQTTISRYYDGTPASITSPDGLTTQLTIDADNHLTHITYPDGSVYEFDYTYDGLLTVKTEPNGNRYEHVFDETGRLTDAIDDENGHWTYNREALSSGDVITEVLTGEGNLTTYTDRTESTGAYASIITDPTGARTHYSRSGDGLTVNKSLPCGMDLGFEYDLDSEYKYKFIKKMTHRTPAGLERVTLRSRTYGDTDQDSIPDLITETVAVNGRQVCIENDVLQSRRTVTTPAGRTVTVNYDTGNLLTRSVRVPDLFDTEYDYDGRGRLTAIMTHTRQTRFTYDGAGNLETYTDPQGLTTTYGHDSLGRVTAVSRPDMGDLTFSYDANGNMTVLTNPSAISHEFGFNGVNLKETYQAPISGSYSYQYDADRRLIQIAFPSGKQIFNIYDTARLAQVQTPQGDIDYTYLCGTTIESIKKGTETITYGYDGSLVTAETVIGTLNQSLNWTYDNDFDVTGFTYAGETVAYEYDNDGLLTRAGSFSIIRNADNGMPEVITGGALAVDRHFNGYGELDGQHVSVGGGTVLQWDLVRDNAGRITTKTERVAGLTSSYGYAYDPMGRLETVTKDGSLVESYTYDLKGTRISEMNTLRGIAGRNFNYSDEDHLLTVGGTTYEYDLDGFLTSKTDGTEITAYTYSLRGELLHVDLPDGRLVSYDHDPLGRRIAKSIDGNIVEKYLWQGLTRLLAVYDGSDNLVQQFEYADGRLPVSMTQAGSIYYLAYNQVGSLKVVTDASGNVIKRIDYDSFGNVLTDTNAALTVPFGFAGGLADRDTGLVRFGYRDYDPDTGRWTAKDPIGFAGGDTDLYGYVQSNPVNWIDPWGLERWHAPDGSHTVGRPGTPVPPGGTISSFIENNVGSGYTFGETHDGWVGDLTEHGIPDVIANIPSMPPAYLWSIYKDLSELPIDERPQNFPLFEMRHDLCGK
ncbi:NHL domain-containing protein [Desulfosarcina alkanivorans]|nr:RHS repeat-associated core domain-containing protein [Desulfosarcina alkanivorans]